VGGRERRLLSQLIPKMSVSVFYLTHLSHLVHDTNPQFVHHVPLINNLDIFLLVFLRKFVGLLAYLSFVMLFLYAYDFWESGMGSGYGVTLH
jgi:hypothetical protein